MLSSINSYNPAFSANSSSSKYRNDVAVAGAGAGSAVVARELATMGRFGQATSSIGAQALKTSAKRANEISNVFLRFTKFLEKAKMPWAAKVLRSKPACKALGVFGSIGAVGITVAELFGAGDVLKKISEI